MDNNLVKKSKIHLNGIPKFYERIDKNDKSSASKVHKLARFGVFNEFFN